MAMPLNVEKDELVLKLKKQKKSFRQISKLINLDVGNVYRRYKRAKESREKLSTV